MTVPCNPFKLLLFILMGLHPLMIRPLATQAAQPLPRLPDMEARTQTTGFFAKVASQLKAPPVRAALAGLNLVPGGGPATQTPRTDLATMSLGASQSFCNHHTRSAFTSPRQGPSAQQLENYFLLSAPSSSKAVARPPSDASRRSSLPSSRPPTRAVARFP